MSKKNLIDEKIHSEDEEDDDDYCPIKKSDSTDESEDADDDNDEIVNEKIETKNQTDLNIAPYDQSKTDALWKSFSSNTNSSSSSSTTTESQNPKSSSSTIESQNTKSSSSTIESQSTKSSSSIIESQNPKPTNKVFDYAGEEISIPVSTTNFSLKRPAASSNSVLDRLGIGKKAKLSTLEKSRLDWNKHKESESLADDLNFHRRSKDSYVERKAFLERTELREHDHYLTNVKKK